MTSFPAAIRPARVNRLLIAGLLVAAGFVSGLGAARFTPVGTSGLPANPVPVAKYFPINAGLSPDDRQATRHATNPVNGAGSPDDRDR